MEKQNEEIDFKEILQLIWERKWIVVISFILSVISITLITIFLIQTKYTATTSLIVTTEERNEGGLSLSDLQVNSQLIEDYKEFISSQLIAEAVAEKQEIKIPYEEYLENLSITTKQNSRFIYISYELPNRVQATLIVNQIAETFIEKVGEVVGDKNIKVVDEAQVPKNPSSPNLKLNIVIGGVSGLVAGILIILLIDILDNRVLKEEDIQKAVQLSVLGVIPKFEGERRG